MFGFSFYQSKQYQKQVEAQAQLDSIAMVEQLQQMALDSAKRASGDTSAVAVKVENMKVYKDSLLNVARNAQEHPPGGTGRCLHRFCRCGDWAARPPAPARGCPHLPEKR